MIPPDTPNPTIPNLDPERPTDRSATHFIPDNNRIECDHGRLKSRLRPIRGLKTDRTASVVIRGHAFIQNLRRGHYELEHNTTSQHLRVSAAFCELVEII
ncbi:MAG: DDE-type integrase/transposase/recombinase [Actinomycetia bacterium]|nr:DDE-type integrase/transposase/recombinase [Actinomycetes bacterium]